MPKETESLILGARFIHLSGQPCSLTLGHGDRGCPDCGKVAAEAAVYIVDARDRYWCASCAADALGEITRRTEDRPDARYRWDFPDHMFDLRRRAARGEEGAIAELRSLQTGSVDAIEHPCCQAVLRAQCVKPVDHAGPHHSAVDGDWEERAPQICGADASIPFEYTTLGDRCQNFRPCAKHGTK